jgi:hypothetical protein
MSFLMRQLMSPYMAPATGNGEDLGGNEAELAKLRGDIIEDDDDTPPIEEVEEVEKTEEVEEVTEEVEEVEEEVSAKKDDKKTTVIPKARFDELNRKSKEQITALSKELEEFRKKATQDTRAEDTKKTEAAIEALEKEAENLLNDGKATEYAAKMREIRVLERALNVAATEFATEKARALAVEQVRMDLLVERLEQEYPAINPDADEYDQGKVDEIMELRSAFEKAGKSSSEALAKAVKYVFADAIARKAENAKPKEKAEDDEKEEKDDKKDKKDDKKDDKEDKSKEKDRKKDAVTRNAKDAKKIPAKAADHGVDSDKKGGGIKAEAVTDMTEEEFEALPESTKARLRGDVVED